MVLKLDSSALSRGWSLFRATYESDGPPAQRGVSTGQLGTRLIDRQAVLTLCQVAVNLFVFKDSQ